MKQIFNFIITGVILYLASVFFSDVVRIADFKSLVLATVLLFIAESLVVIIIFTMMAFSFLHGSVIGTIIIGVIMICFAEIIALSFVSAWLPGVTIDGFWTKFILAFALSVFRIPNKKDDD